MVSARTGSALLAFGLLLSACAATPPQDLLAAGTEPTATASSEGEVLAAASTEGIASSPATEAGSTVTEPIQARVVDLNKESPNEVDNSGQVCRVMLRPNSNVLVNVCGTPAQWKKYQVAEAQAAQELLLKMQFQHLH